MRWVELISAVALLLVFEGIAPFINPTRWRRTMRLITEQPDNVVRFIGLSSMVLGAGLLYFLRLGSG